MYRISEFTKDTYRVHEVANIIGVSAKTIRRCDNDGRIKMTRTEGGHRIMKKGDLIELLRSKNLIISDADRQDDENDSVPRNEIKGLDDLNTLIGTDAVNRCMHEYMSRVMEFAEKSDAMSNHRATMSEPEMNAYLDGLCSTEIFKKTGDSNEPEKTERMNECLAYFPAVKTALVAHGYDEQWIDTVFKKSFDNRCMHEQCSNTDFGGIGNAVQD